MDGIFCLFQPNVVESSYALPCAFGQCHPTGTGNDRSDFNELVRACVRYFCGGKLRAYQTRHKPARDIRQKLRILSIYAKLIALIDRQEMKAPLLARLKAKFGTDGKRTSEILKELATELDKLDLRNNQIMYVLLEGSLFWQLRQVMRIEAWRKNMENVFFIGWICSAKWTHSVRWELLRSIILLILIL